MKFTKKNTLICTICLLVASIILGLIIIERSSDRSLDPQTPHYKIGIFQVARHPVLDAMADTFQKHAKENLSGKIVFVALVPEGDASKNEQMAQRFVSDKFDLVFVIGTNQAQTLAKKTSTIPIVLGAATDPQAAGLVKSWEHPGANVTGTSDLSPIASQLTRLLEILPQAKRIGIIYNPAEDNSGIIVSRFKDECKARGLTSVTATVSNQNEVRQTLVSLVGKIDVLYAPTDATIQSAFPLLIGTANELNIPVFDCDEGTVKDGALFSVGFNYSDLGRISAEMAIDILENGKSPSGMPIRLADTYQLFYNPTQVNRYSLSLPDSWQEQGTEVSR